MNDRLRPCEGLAASLHLHAVQLEEILVQMRTAASPRSSALIDSGATSVSMSVAHELLDVWAVGRMLLPPIESLVIYKNRHAEALEKQIDADQVIADRMDGVRYLVDRIEQGATWSF